MAGLGSILGATFSSTSSSSPGKEGKDWQNKLYWYPNAAHTDNEDMYMFEQGQEDLFFRQCMYNLSEEKIKSMIFYKTPLAPEHFGKLIMVPLGIGWTYKLCHLYVVAETDSGKFFCFAKSCESIELYCSGNEENIYASQYQTPDGEGARMIPGETGIVRQLCLPKEKLTVIERSTRARARGNIASVADIVKWIFNTRQLVLGYNTADRNCKDFAVDLWNFFTPENEQVSPSYMPFKGETHF
eukprot:GFUD01015132.1.p1 GENE.GFUD01015132.1~~GFUD01015132.1.p1  ORF type:complete len:242 (+),score=39.69 GFUD01015132.1:43-768(+)